MGSRRRNFPWQHSGLLTIIVLALVLKILYLASYHSLPLWDQLTVDNYYHHNWAQTIAGGNILGDTTYFRAPLYVLCLGTLYAIFGASLWVARIFGVAIGLLSIVASYMIGRRIFDHRVGLIAAAIQAVYPTIIYFECELLVDPLFMLLLQLTVYKSLVWWETRKPADIAVTGLLLGLAAITRPTALIFFPLVVLLLLTSLESFRRAVSQLLLLVLGMALAILPITVRNMAVAGDPVLISSQGGINLYIGNNDVADGISAVLPEPMGFNWRIQQVAHVAETELGRSLKPGEVSSYWYGRAIEWILENPADFLRLYLKKLYFSFSDREISNNRNLAYFFDQVSFLRFNLLSFGVLFSLTVIAFFLCLGRNPKGMFLMVLIITYSIVSALFFFSSRFRLPLLPFYIILASASLYWISSRLFSQWRLVVWPIAGAVVFGFFSFYPLAGVPLRSSSQHLTSEGLYYLATEQYRLALGAFQRARQIDMAFPETNLNIGSSYMRLGQLDSALYYFREEERLNPARAKANINIASIHLLAGDFDEASREIKKALEVRPWDIIANMIAVRIFFADSLLSSADLADSADHIARRCGSNIRVLNDAALRFSGKGEMELAEAFLRQAIISTPPPVETDDYAFERNYINSTSNWAMERAKAFYQLGFINGLRGNFDLSIEYSREAIRLDSTYAEAYVNLISGYISTGRLAEARTTLAEAASRFPDNEYIRQIQTRIGQ